MHNDKILKEIRVLYVEDDDGIRKNFSDILVNFFPKIETACDGAEGLERFKQSCKDNQQFEVIISDVNMPNMNGIEMLTQIKSINNKIITLLTTAYSDSNFLFDAIKIKVDHYGVKPINAKEFIKQISDLYMARFNDIVIINQQKKLQKLFDVIDQFAMITKTDLAGNITYANSLFCEISGYVQSELIGQPHNIVRHPEVPESVFAELWQTISSNHTWKSNLKNRAKDGSTYYANTTIFPVCDGRDGSITEYMSIRYASTDDTNKAREFKKSVMKKIQECKKEEIKLKNKIKQLENKIVAERHFNNSGEFDTSLMQQTLMKEKQKTKNLMSQVTKYEKDIKMHNDKIEAIEEEHQKKIKTLNKDLSDFKNKAFSGEGAQGEMKRELDEKTKTIDKLQTQNEDLIHRVKDLESSLNHKEQEYKDLQKSMMTSK
jgi:PAS domain S-box-containing protein